ncbi:MAG: ABC transporter ATP-binding protein, partial [Acidilobaceae archaeon]
MEEVVLENVDKAYGKVKALDRVSIKVMRGELFTILGPSGCGKTTTLRVIAGFEIPDSGRVYIDGVDVTFKKPYERSTAMVFQNYALWPHMSVFDNIAYGLKLRGYSEAEIKKRVGWVLELLDLKGLEKRYPLQLSGGQQQRVALARALVVEPKVLLLDEPLSNLDARLRLRVREEIVALQKKLGITTVYVTHDQEEAMSISDRIAVMDKGRVVQVGTPWEVYNKPVNYFVATFMGRSNTLNGIVSERVSEELYEVDVKGIKLYGIAPGGESLDRGLNVAVVIRPESLRRAEEDDKVNIIEGSVRRVSLLGYTLQVRVDLSNGASVTAYLPSKESV